MATNTTNYGFKKPDESDFYDVADQNKNWDLADEALKNLDTPTFEDYTGSTAVPSATDAIDQIKSKGKLGTLLSNIKAAFKGACLIGHIVNNCVTDNAGLPLSAAQGKALMDKYTQLYSEMSTNSWSQLITVGDVCGIRLDYRYNPCLKLCEIFWDGKNSAEIKVNSKNFMWDGFPDDKLPKRNTFVPMASTTPGLTIRFYPVKIKSMMTRLAVIQCIAL